MAKLIFAKRPDQFRGWYLDAIEPSSCCWLFARLCCYQNIEWNFALASCFPPKHESLHCASYKANFRTNAVALMLGRHLQHVLCAFIPRLKRGLLYGAFLGSMGQGVEKTAVKSKFDGIELRILPLA